MEYVDIQGFKRFREVNIFTLMVSFLYIDNPM